MKTVFTAALLFASLVSGFSQTEGPKLVDRIMKPDMRLGNTMGNRSFSDSAVIPMQPSAAAGKAFYGIKEAPVKDFSTRSFFGLKNPWFGKKIFATKDAASTSAYEVKQAGFNKTADAPGFYAATKGADFGFPVVPVSAFVPDPAAKGAVSRISDKINEKMTIEEVREILNKNH